jgi:anti-anti-sigma factor
MSLTISIAEKEAGLTEVVLDGRLDTDTSSKLESRVEEILEKDPRVLLFNMEKLDYISSMGIRAVFKALKAMRVKGGKLLLVNLQKQIKKVFDIAQALPPESIFVSVEEADAYLDAMQKEVLDKDG